MTDPILLANEMALEAHRRDFEFAVGPDMKEMAPERPGPTATTRVLAIAHLAMYDAWNSVSPVGAPYLPGLPHAPAGLDAGVAALAATARVLTHMYSRQTARIADDLSQHLGELVVAGGLAGDVVASLSHGAAIGELHFVSREKDPSGDQAGYVPPTGRGQHRVDPFALGQGYLHPLWGTLKPFAVTATGAVAPVPDTPVLPIEGSEFVEQFNSVKRLGAAHGSTRTPLQTLIGVFWGYDGAKKIGTPPRLYNQAIRALADTLKTTSAQNVRLFALINMGMADAGIFAWKSKYEHTIRRPVLGIREEGPSEPNAAQKALEGDPSWAPLGAPQTNRSGQFQTPNFPAYPSGHATFGTAAFRLADLFLSTEFPGAKISEMPFVMTSDEYNDASIGADGGRRPSIPRRMTLHQAIEENKVSRIYLGVHWKMDADEGERIGEAIAKFTFETQLLKSSGR
jgi:hypothetical protein